jgi:peroxiredoxin
MKSKKGIRFVIAVILLQASLSLIAASQAAAPSAKEPEDRGYVVQVGNAMPSFQVTMVNGKVIRLEDLRGKVVMLQFTASWCIVCRTEMPQIQSDIWEAYKDRSDFALIGVDMDEPLPTVRKFKEDVGVTYPMALDPGGKVFQLVARKGAGVTRNIILDRKGKIVFLTRLYDKAEFEQMKAKIAEELAR